MNAMNGSFPQIQTPWQVRLKRVAEALKLEGQQPPSAIRLSARIPHSAGNPCSWLGRARGRSPQRYFQKNAA
jgi:hypothetical protein